VTSRIASPRLASPRLASRRAEVVVANINGHRWALPRSRCAVVDRHRSSIVVIIVARIRRNPEAYSEKVPRAARFLARARARVEAHAVYILCVTLSFYPGLAAPSRVTSLAVAEVRKVHAVRHPRWKLHSWKCHDGLLHAAQKKWRKIPPRERRRGIRLSRDGESRERRTAGSARLAAAKGISAAAPSRACGIFHGARFHVRFNIKTTARKVSLPPSRFPHPPSPTLVRGCLPLSLLSRALTHASGWFCARERARCN